MLKIYCDTGAYRAELTHLERQGRLCVFQFKYENKNRKIRRMAAPSQPSISELNYRIDELGGLTVSELDKTSPKRKVIQELLGPNNVRDAKHLDSAYMKVVLANGGIPLSLMREHFPNEFDPPGVVVGGSEDADALALLHTLFTLPVNADANAYRWSIACGLANGFAAVCERTSKETIDGNTKLSGRYPFSGIAYASMRKDRQAINFAFNDLGMTYLKLNHIQWVERGTDGHFSGIDYASAWDADGNIAWQGRAAHYLLQPGSAARVVKVSDTVWHYEQLDGGLPEFI